jgi:hypothetical protein
MCAASRRQSGHLSYLGLTKQKPIQKHLKDARGSHPISSLFTHCYSHTTMDISPSQSSAAIFFEPEPCGWNCPNLIATIIRKTLILQLRIISNYKFLLCTIKHNAQLQ